MKGATAELWVKKISAPSNNNITTIGVIHHFLFCIRYCQNSFNKLNFDISLSPPKISFRSVLC